MTKKDRQAWIKEIISEKSISNQEELVKVLEMKGSKVAQTTISRDIHEMGIFKGPKGYRLPEEVSNSKDLEQIFKSNVTQVDGVDYFIVIHTQPAGANSVAFHLDQGKNEAILGTIAGDDTLMVILKDKKRLESLLKTFKGYLK